VLTAGVLVVGPLLVLGAVAQGVESLRRRIGNLAIGAVVLAGLVASLAVWWFPTSEDASQAQSGILAASVGILVTLFSFIYWLVLASGGCPIVC
jgi:hypothetical protein